MEDRRTSEGVREVFQGNEQGRNWKRTGTNEGGNGAIQLFLRPIKIWRLNKTFVCCLYIYSSYRRRNWREGSHE